MNNKFQILDKELGISIEWLLGQIDQQGALSDAMVNDTLDHQYHMAWTMFIISQCFDLEKDAIRSVEFDRLMNYQFRLPKAIIHNSSSFIAIPLLLCYRNLKPSPRKYRIEEWLLNLELEPDFENQNRANNFFLMKCVALALKEKLIGGLSDENRFFLDNIVNIKIADWQLQDGFFYDKPFTGNGVIVPHLTYHSTISMLVAWLGKILNNRSLLDRANKGFHALSLVSSNEGEIGFYGRSNNAIFGYGSAVFGISMLNPNSNLEAFRNKLLFFLKNRCWRGDHFNIVPSGFPANRDGYDRYMFDVVYNSWLIGMIILAKSV